MYALSFLAGIEYSMYLNRADVVAYVLLIVVISCHVDSKCLKCPHPCQEEVFYLFGGYCLVLTEGWTCLFRMDSELSTTSYEKGL